MEREFRSGLHDERLDPDAAADFIDFGSMFRAARRQWLPVAVGCVLGAILGLAYVFTAVPLYTASVSVLIDRGNREVIEQLTAASGLIDDEATVLNEVELLKSDSIGLSVIDKLNLTENREFMSGGGSIFGSVRSLIRSALSGVLPIPEPKTDVGSARLDALRVLEGNVSIQRVGRTYVLNVSYVSASAQLSARIANAFSDAYLVDKLNAKYDATRRAGTWLQDRIAELRQRALETDLAVQRFRADNGLVSAGEGNILLSDQQLSELNTSLITAKANTSRAQARLASIEQIIASGQTEAVVTDALGSMVSNELRSKYLEASKREAEISAKLGPNHSQAVRLRSEMGEYRRLMFEELGRIAQSYKNELDVALAQEKSIESSVESATSVSKGARETQVQLRELEREADTYKNLYQTFLERYQTTVQQQSFPITEARVISAASVPENPSHPKKALMLALFIVIGVFFGLCIGAYREFRERFFRTGDQVRDSLGLEFLGTVSDLPSEDLRNEGSVDPRRLRKTKSVFNYTVEHPLSSFAETLRSVKIAADVSAPSKSCRIIGVISALPGEGKSTIAINLAELLALQGAKTVLIDADLRNPSATRALGAHATEGLIEVLLSQVDTQSVLLHNPSTGLRFLPAVVKTRVAHSSELLGSASMRKILGEIGSVADYIVIDLPPLGPVVDARAIASSVDGFLMVTEWGKTARRIVNHVLDADPVIREKCLGVVLNKVDPVKMKLYQDYGSSSFYHSRYAAYYQDGR